MERGEKMKNSWAFRGFCLFLRRNLINSSCLFTQRIQTQRKEQKFRSAVYFCSTVTLGRYGDAFAFFSSLYCATFQNVNTNFPCIIINNNSGSDDEERTIFPECVYAVLWNKRANYEKIHSFSLSSFSFASSELIRFEFAAISVPHTQSSMLFAARNHRRRMLKEFKNTVINTYTHRPLKWNGTKQRDRKKTHTRSTFCSTKIAHAQLQRKWVSEEECNQPTTKHNIYVL